MDTEQLQHYRRRLKALEQERQSWETHWKELGEMFLPRRTRFLSDRVSDGGKRHNLAHSTPLLAARTLASGMQSGLTNPARPWFRLSLHNADAARSDAARAWLYDTQQKMSNIFAGSNFYDMVHTLYRELGVFGTGYPYRFALPSDCVQPLLLEGGGAWRVMGQDIYTDTSTASLHYTARVDDPRQWTAAFFSAVAWALAAELSTAVVNDVRRQQLCAQEYMRALETAKAESLNAQTAQAAERPWLEARR